MIWAEAKSALYASQPDFHCLVSFERCSTLREYQAEKTDLEFFLLYRSANAWFLEEAIESDDKSPSLNLYAKR
jgi:hypothetical protein